MMVLLHRREVPFCWPSLHSSVLWLDGWTCRSETVTWVSIVHDGSGDEEKAFHRCFFFFSVVNESLACLDLNYNRESNDDVEKKRNTDEGRNDLTTCGKVTQSQSILLTRSLHFLIDDTSTHKSMRDSWCDFRSGILTCYYTEFHLLQRPIIIFDYRRRMIMVHVTIEYLLRRFSWNVRSI